MNLRHLKCWMPEQKCIENSFRNLFNSLYENISYCRTNEYTYANFNSHSRAMVTKISINLTGVRQWEREETRRSKWKASFLYFFLLYIYSYINEKCVYRYSACMRHTSITKRDDSMYQSAFDNVYMNRSFVYERPLHIRQIAWSQPAERLHTRTNKTENIKLHIYI